MFKNYIWLNLADDLDVELLQSRDEGRDVRSMEDRVSQIKALKPDDPQREELAAALYDEISRLPAAAGYEDAEPSDLEAIKAARSLYGKNLKLENPNLSEEDLYNKIYGAWLGRCCGCLLGQPIEGWHRERILGLLKDTGNYPINYYISSSIQDDLREKYQVVDGGNVYGRKMINWINNINYMPEDDDTNYTVIGLKVLEEFGYNFTPDDVAETWLMNLPLLHVCTAERVAYKNLANLLPPPESAYYRNPYREWIGAQIRADFFGYVTPGSPELGAELAWRDASISHIKNGIYGEMFVAAMISAAFCSNDLERIIHTGLSQIPEKSRLYKEIETVLDWKRQGITWECAIERIHEKYDEKNRHHWCHTISNAVVVCVSLLFGELDFEKSIGIAVSAGFDTDCNGATVGSVLGVILGSKALPGKWISPLDNKLKSGVDGFGLVEISDLAKRTVEIINVKRH